MYGSYKLDTKSQLIKTTRYQVRMAKDEELEEEEDEDSKSKGKSILQ